MSDPVGGQAGGSAPQRVLQVARDLFCAQGYEQTPLREIADALGVTKAALYYHFKAKDDLLTAIVVPLLDRIDAVIDATGTAPDRRSFLTAYVDELAGHPDVLGLLLRDSAVIAHPTGRRFGDQHLRMRRLLGATEAPAGAIRVATALRAMELAVVEFPGTDPAQLRETAVSMALAVLDSDVSS